MFPSHDPEEEHTSTSNDAWEFYTGEFTANAGNTQFNMKVNDGGSGASSDTAIFVVQIKQKED